MRPLPVLNPPNPWASSVVEYLEEPPTIGLEVYEDQSRSILSKNDSPDLPFTYSVNPYRGCLHACAYCMDGDTPILLSNGNTRQLRDIHVGDMIYGTESDGEYRRLVRTRVLAHWTTIKPAYRITLADATILIASGDHRFLTERGWKFVSDTHPIQRAHLTTNNRLIGTGTFAAPPLESNDYKRGYLCGMVLGDAHLKEHHQRSRPSPRYRFRLALVDLEALMRARRYLAELELETRKSLFAEAHGNFR